MYYVAAFYHFFPINDPAQEVKDHKDFFAGKDVKGRIYIDQDGINAQFSGSSHLVNEYLRWLEQKTEGVEVKIDESSGHAFYKLSIKNRPLVAFGAKVDLSKRGKYLSPAQWKEKLEEASPKKRVIIDARNGYEAKVGHFQDALVPPCTTFREFPSFVDSLLEKERPEEVMMYCTGGIRCEYLSSYLRQKGCKDVYQLHGGVIAYGKEEGDNHWKGKLFVFDDRLVVPISDTNKEPITKCFHCDKLCDTYCNCANMDCNALFICCQECAQQMKGACSDSCCSHPRKRSFDPSAYPKPFRKWTAEQKQALVS